MKINCLIMNLSVLLISLSICISVISAAVLQPEINSANNALMYLSRFGYIDHSATNRQLGGLMAKEAVREALMEFQAFAGLNQTGILDERTLEMMNTPRCGVVDKVGYGSNARRKKRYALQGSRWKVNDLTYKITKYPKQLTISEVDRDIDRAFKVWSEVTELTFTAVRTGKVHIEVRFERGEHGDGDAFDGPGGTLAHAYFPIYGGDAHFDDSETWTIDSYRGTNLFQVAAHEFGHSLGLSHSDVQSALMAPFYRGYQARFSLDDDDITAIQSLYGKKTVRDKTPSPPKPTIPTKPTNTDSVLCKDGSIDAIVTMEDKKTYVFKGKNFWMLSDDGIEKGYPKSISKEFYGLPSYLDAAFTWTNGKTYFFKGSEYWRFTGHTMDDDYPKDISKGFSGIPENVDAAFVWSGNGKIYFFKGTDYYKFDPTQRPPVSSKYPKDLSIWEGLPYYMDDAFQYSNGYTYFFKNGKYWRFNDRTFQVDSADEPFPRQVGPWWFGCPDKGSHSASPDQPNVPLLLQSASPDQPNVPLLLQSASPDQPNVPNTRNNPSDVSDDDAFNTDNYDDYYYNENSLNPRIGNAASKDYTYDDKYSNTQNSGNPSSPLVTLPWLVIPIVFKYICI